METEDIEKLKEAAFAAAELLKSLPHHGSFHGEDRAEIIAKIEAFKPEPVIFEAWGNFYEGWVPCLYRDPERAKLNAGEGASRVAVHLREVTPAPEWERWKVGEISQWFGVAEGNGKLIASATAPNCKLIADAHNAEMRRVTGTEGK